MTDKKRDYQEMFERIREALAHSPEELSRWVELSEKYLSAARDMTKDELALIEAYFKRDVQEFGQQYDDAKDSEEQQGLFNDLISNSIWEQLAEITDKTQLEWREVMADIQHHGIYEAGELVGLGVLQCENCQHQTPHSHVDVLHPCVKCGHRFFSRRAYPA